MPFDNHPADIDRLSWLRDELSLLQDEIGQMVERNSWQAVVAARRLALSYRDQIDQLVAEKGSDEFEPTTVDEVVAQVLALPDSVFVHPEVIARVARCSGH